MKKEKVVTQKTLNEIPQQALDIIIKISKILCYKYTFDCYGPEDIEQEAILIGVEGYSRWDQVRPLENFMYTHINNRLKNFKRDNYYRMPKEGEPDKIQNQKREILDAVTLTDGVIQKESNLDSILDFKILINKVESSLQAKDRRDFLRLVAGAKIPPKRKQEIISICRKIIGENYELE